MSWLRKSLRKIFGKVVAYCYDRPTDLIEQERAISSLWRRVWLPLLDIGYVRTKSLCETLVVYQLI